MLFNLDRSITPKAKSETASHLHHMVEENVADPSLCLQEAETARRTKEVVYNLNKRVRQELAYPSIVHLYVWLLHGNNLIWENPIGDTDYCLATVYGKAPQ